jgi:hypothetical protein
MLSGWCNGHPSEQNHEGCLIPDRCECDCHSHGVSQG